MTVVRNSAEFNTQGMQPVQAQQSNMGFARPDVAKFDQGQSNSSDSFLSNIVGAVLPEAYRFGKAVVPLIQEEAYLNGQQAAIQGQAEAELDSNPLTRDWTVAGHRDTATKLLFADTQAQVAADMKRMASESPEKFAEYIKDQRAKIMPDIEGMSAEGRKQMFMQQVTFERAVTQDHAVKHAAWQIDQKQKAASANVSVSLESLNGSMKDTQSYNSATDNAFNTIYQESFGNAALPDQNKHNILGEAMELALKNNHQALFMRLRNVKVPSQVAGEPPSSMFSQLKLEEQQKLTELFNKSMDETAATRNADFSQNLGLVRANFDDPKVPLIRFDQLQSLLGQGVQMKALSAERQESIVMEWAKAQQKRNNATAGGNDWVNQNINGMWKAGVDDQQGYDGWLEGRKQAGIERPKMMQEHVDLIKTNGSPALVAGLGKLLAPSIASMWLPDANGKQKAEEVAGVLRELDNSEGKDRNYSIMLSALPEKEWPRIQQFRDLVKENGNPALSAAMVADTIAKQVNSGGESYVAAKRALDVNDDHATVAEIAKDVQAGPIGYALKQFAGYLGFGKQTADTAVRNGWTEDNALVSAASQSYVAAVSDELAHRRNTMPMAGQAERRSAAEAAVYARTVKTDSGPLVFPRLPAGQTVQSFLGLPESTTSDVMGKAIQSSVKPSNSDARVVFSVVNGKITYQEYTNGSGTAKGKNGEVSFDQVRAMVDIENKRRTDSVLARQGPGTQVKGTDGYNVTFNGLTATPGVSADAMYDFRKTLINSEGVIGAPRVLKDTQGKDVTTVGVGLTKDWLPKAQPDGTYAARDLDLAFARASDNAMQAGQNVAASTGLGVKSRPLFAELAYHSGPGFANLPTYKPFLDAMRAKDKAKALTSFEGTKAWANSGEPRRKHYLDLINKSME